jgi:hypothetical protein
MPDTLAELFESNSRKTEIVHTLTAAVEQQLRLCLPGYPRVKAGRALRIERHRYDAANQTAEECRNPFRAVGRPEQDAIPFLDASGFQLPRELKSGRPEACS